MTMTLMVSKHLTNSTADAHKEGLNSRSNTQHACKHDYSVHNYSCPYVAHYYQSPTVSLTLKENILNYKFDKHDKSQDDKLQYTEYFLLQNDLSEFLHCDAILEYIKDKITGRNSTSSTNQPFSISRKEFQQFFAAELFEGMHGILMQPLTPMHLFDL